MDRSLFRICPPNLLDALSIGYIQVLYRSFLSNIPIVFSVNFFVLGLFSFYTETGHVEGYNYYSEK